MIECRDSTGKILAANGNGTWINFDKNFLIITGKGQIIDGAKSGEWHGNTEDSCSYTISYINGKEGPGIGYDKMGKPHPFSEWQIQASFKGGNVEFGKFLSANIVYPKEDRRNNVQGKVIFNFVVEKDGSVSNIKILKSPDDLLGNEALRVVQLSPPWIPGLMYGLPVRAYFTVPVNFNLTNGR